MRPAGHGRQQRPGEGEEGSPPSPGKPKPRSEGTRRHPAAGSEVAPPPGTASLPARGGGGRRRRHPRPRYRASLSAHRLLPRRRPRPSKAEQKEPAPGPRRCPAGRGGVPGRGPTADSPAALLQAPARQAGPPPLLHKTPGEPGRLPPTPPPAPYRGAGHGAVPPHPLPGRGRLPGPGSLGSWLPPPPLTATTTWRPHGTRARRGRAGGRARARPPLLLRGAGPGARRSRLLSPPRSEGKVAAGGADRLRAPRPLRRRPARAAVHSPEPGSRSPSAGEADSPLPPFITRGGGGGGRLTAGSWLRPALARPSAAQSPAEAGGAMRWCLGQPVRQVINRCR